jgi:hypothetical protein
VRLCCLSAARSGVVTSVELHDAPAAPAPDTAAAEAAALDGAAPAPPPATAAATRSAIVSFENASSLDTALLLSGATIVAGEPPITVVASLIPDAAAGAAAAAVSAGTPHRVRGPGDDDDLIDFQRVSDVMSTLMAKGFVLGKDALAKAKVGGR